MSKPQIPVFDPDRWHTHPAWTSQAYDALVGFHDRYRRESSRLVAVAQDEAVSVPDVAASCRQLEDFLHNHEAVEEQGLYPWIEQHYDIDFAALREEHQQLNELVRALLAYLASAAPNRPTIRAHLATLDRALREHLAREEAVCVPALLAMSPEAYARMTA